MPATRLPRAATKTTADSGRSPLPHPNLSDICICKRSKLAKNQKQNPSCVFREF